MLIAVQVLNLARTECAKRVDVQVSPHAPTGNVPIPGTPISVNIP